VTNGCRRKSMWIAHMEGGGVSAWDPQNVRLGPGRSYDFNITDGLSSTRYWPKLGCNRQGRNCAIGDSGGPGQGCPEHGCGPPVDSKFEATFGAVGQPCRPEVGQIAGCDWLDVSLVDGFTTPFKVELIGDCGGHRGVDCSALQLSGCPKELRIRDPISKRVAGCYSPCAKLTYPHWGNEAGKYGPRDEEAKMMCCPTPPVSPQQCMDGPVARSSYVKMVHQSCPGVYGYAYDDAEGLSLCKSGVQYKVTFYCPVE